MARRDPQRRPIVRVLNRRRTAEAHPVYPVYLRNDRLLCQGYSVVPSERVRENPPKPAIPMPLQQTYRCASAQQGQAAVASWGRQEERMHRVLHQSPLRPNPNDSTSAAPAALRTIMPRAPAHPRAPSPGNPVEIRAARSGRCRLHPTASPSAPTSFARREGAGR